jgi:hypothetical protein
MTTDSVTQRGIFYRKKTLSYPSEAAALSLGEMLGCYTVNGIPFYGKTVDS